MSSIILSAINIKNEETFTCTVQQYGDLMSEYLPELKVVALQISKEDCEQTQFGYKARIKDIADGETAEPLVDSDLVHFFEGKKREHDQIYINSAIYTKMNIGASSVLFISLDDSIYKDKEGKEIKYHQTKVINVF